MSSEQNSPMRRKIRIEWDSAMARFFERVDDFARVNQISEEALTAALELEVDGNVAEDYTEWADGA